MKLAGPAMALAGYAVLVVICVATLRYFEPVRVVGGSMRPALMAGDLVLVDRAVSPHAGDIALLKVRGHGPVLHRVIGVDEAGRLRTKGDANQTADVRPVERRDVRGIVVRVVPVGSLIERWRR